MSIRDTPKILIVEDDLENRLAMVRVLEGASYKTIETDNGDQALDRVLKQNVDIVISDLRLPGMDGVELLKQSKKSQEYAVPVTEAGRLGGLLTSDNVAEFFMLRTALEQSRQKQTRAA